LQKDLTNSTIDRQNILNNQYAVNEIQKAVNLQGIIFQGKLVFLIDHVANFFEVTARTIKNYISNNEEELSKNGYEVLRGKRLSEFKLTAKWSNLSETDFPDIKAPQLAIFDFRAFLNLGMMLVESNSARLLRQAILDIVIDTINVKTGGGTKYINQRDEDFLRSWFEGENYRKHFTDALRDYVDAGNFKYPLYTDKIYVSIFKEQASEYRAILRLHKQDKTRDTFYAEILDLIAAYEYGFAKMLEEEFIETGRKLSINETERLFMEFESQSLWKPLVEKARVKMASRDLVFRDALHMELKEYIAPLQAEEFERFLGEKSMELAERLEKAKDVMKRLKDRE
jgi:hypothetical protein